MSAVPGPVYGLEIPPGEILIPASMEFPASVRLPIMPLKRFSSLRLCDSANTLAPADSNMFLHYSY